MQEKPRFWSRVLLANTENSALIRTNEFFGPDLDQGGFTATSCKDQLSFHHFGINQEHRLIPEGGRSSTRIARFFQDFFWGSPNEVPLSATFWQSVRHSPGL